MKGNVQPSLAELIKDPAQAFANLDQAEKAAGLLQDCLPSAQVWAMDTGTPKEPAYRVAIAELIELQGQLEVEWSACTNARAQFDKKHKQPLDYFTHATIKTEEDRKRYGIDDAEWKTFCQVEKVNKANVDALEALLTESNSRYVEIVKGVFPETHTAKMDVHSRILFCEVGSEKMARALYEKMPKEMMKPQYDEDTKAGVVLFKLHSFREEEFKTALTNVAREQRRDDRWLSTDGPEMCASLRVIYPSAKIALMEQERQIRIRVPADKAQAFKEERRTFWDFYHEQTGNNMDLLIPVEKAPYLNGFNNLPDGYQFNHRKTSTPDVERIKDRIVGYRVGDCQEAISACFPALGNMKKGGRREDGLETLESTVINKGIAGILYETFPAVMDTSVPVPCQKAGMIRFKLPPTVDPVAFGAVMKAAAEQYQAASVDKGRKK